MRRNSSKTNTYGFFHWLAAVCAITLCLLSCSVWAFEPRFVLGDAAEGLMQDFFQREGWKPVPGQVGRQGIDGLFVKTEHGIVKDVLVVESKYGTNSLADNLVCGKRQMSQAWNVCKLDDLINSSKKSGGNPESIHQYEQIKKHIEKNNYRSELWRVRPENGKLRVNLQQIKGKGENIRVGKETLNKVIDLKNPQDSFQKWGAGRYEENLGKSLKTHGVPDMERNKMIEGVRKNPARISKILNQYAIKSPSIPRPSGVSIAKTAKHIPMAPLAKRATKGFIKSFGKNIKMGLTGAGIGSAVPVIGTVVGFLGGIVVGMAADYLIDVAVDSVFASESPGQVSAEQQAEIRKVIEESAAQTQKSIQAVEQRMVQEFSILGQNIQQKHNEEMAAINLNISISRNIEGIVKRIHADLLTGIDSLSEQMKQINFTLDSISSRIDKILDRLDASLKASYDNGIYYLELYDYDSTKDVEHLRKAESNLTRFIHTFERMATKSAEEEEILLMALSYRAATLAELFAVTKNKGYAKNSVEDFLALRKRSVNIDFLNMAYLSIIEADLEGEAARKILPLNKERIRYNLLVGEIDEALKQADFLTIPFSQNKDAQIFRNALFEYVNSGKSRKNVIEFEDPDYMVLAQYVNNNGVVPQTTTESDYVKNIIAGNSTPSDYRQMLNRYQNTAFVIFSVRKMVNEGYYDDALDILNTFSINDDTFRVKAYLLLLKETDTDKFHELQSLVLSNNTYSKDVKDFAEKSGL